MKTKIILIILLILLPFSCSDPDDRREDVRAGNGEPSYIYPGSYGPYKYEVWIYDSLDVGYEFRETAPKCGTSKKGWYVAYTFRPSDPYLYDYYKTTPSPHVMDREENDRALEP